MNTYTLLFEDIGAADLPKVGGKGANLGELSRAGFNVPLGFCVTTDAFTRFMAGAKEDIYAQLDTVRIDDLEHLRRVGESVRAHLGELPLPQEVEAAVLEAWLELGDAYAYAVRSSATAEDLPHASFAGQQDTYLNVRGKDYLLRRVKDCFISLFTDRAILYRVQNGFGGREVLLSVVVQRMVQPEVAGIMFTADPMTGDRNIVSVDASFGLGEALVSGLVSADLYRVDKAKGQILDKQIATKQMAIRSRPGGGVQHTQLDESERNQQALEDESVLELAKVGERIEAHYGTPQDIEWALADDALYVTQSRPITSLFPAPEPKPADDALHVYFSFSHFQVMTDAVKPLALSVLRTVIPVGHAGGQLESVRMPTAGGRLYGDLSPLLRHPLGKRLILRAITNADQLAAGALETLAERRDFKARGERVNPLQILPKARPYLFKLLRMLFWGEPEGMIGEVNRIIEAETARIKGELENTDDLREKLKIAVTELQGFFGTMLHWAPWLGAGAAATALLHALMKNTDASGELAAVGRGLSGNVATEMNLSVGDLADAARDSGTLLDVLNQTDVPVEARLEQAATLPEGETFLLAWNAFLQKYGSRGPSEIDLSRPRWAEDPGSLLQMVLGVTGGEAGAHREHHQKLVVEGEAGTEALTKKAYKGVWGPLRGPLVRRFTRVSRQLMPLREHHKFLAVKVLALIKPVLTEAGEQFEKEGRLGSPKDIWFLTLTEILGALDKPEQVLKSLVEKRKANFKHYQTLTPPRVITSQGEIPALGLEVDAPDGALVGSPVSPGVVEGVAKVVLDPSREALKPGEILVAPFTDPGWTPLFVNAAGLVTEVGGLMTHGSLVAREYGVPAVVGVVDATTQIKTGQRLRVHGDAGYVEFLDDTNDDVDTTSDSQTETVSA